MIRWLQIARAVLVRDFTLALRYPLDMLTGVFILYVLFMALFTGARLSTGALNIGANLNGLVIGYIMWFFAMMAINSMSFDIESEARQGTLEQVVIHAPNYLGLLWVRAVEHLTLGASMVILLALAIQASTGIWLQITWHTLLPIVATVALSVLGLCGIGLILGGLSLVFKRIGQVSAIVQFGLLFLALTDTSRLSPGWQATLQHVPLAPAVALLRILTTPGAELASVPARLGLLLVDTIFYALLGTVCFAIAFRGARRAGSLSHY